jgi:hypothetical protein
MDFTESHDFNSFFNKLKNETSHENIMFLSIYVDSKDDTLKNMYKDAATKHNDKILSDPHFYDAGFDIFLPTDDVRAVNYYGCGTSFWGADTNGGSSVQVNKVDFKVKCCAKMYNEQPGNSQKFFYTPFYTYARSSISKTPLRLANNQGIIDAGYRGSLIGMFDCIYNDPSDDKEYDWYMDDYSRMLQICAPGLMPIVVTVVDELSDLGGETARGSGGFGSTGK